jgi:hypothetical protein
MSNHLPTTRWTLVPKPVPTSGAIVRRYSLVPVAASCAPVPESEGADAAE